MILNDNLFNPVTKKGWYSAYISETNTWGNIVIINNWQDLSINSPIYYLKNQPISHGETLIHNDWGKMPINDPSTEISNNTYWFYFL